jgi:signal peptidase II
MIVVFTVAAVIVLLDQLSKAWVVSTMPGRAPLHLIGTWLQVTYTRNPGAAFSLGGGFTVVLSLVAVGVIVFIVRTASRLASVAWAIALGGVLGGALGNVSDRLFRAPGPFRGHVVDWIELPHWPIFNIADASIVCSAILMVVLSLRGIGLDGVRSHN